MLGARRNGEAAKQGGADVRPVRAQRSEECLFNLCLVGFLEAKEQSLIYQIFYLLLFLFYRFSIFTKLVTAFCIASTLLFRTLLLFTGLSLKLLWGRCLRHLLVVLVLGGVRSTTTLTFRKSSSSTVHCHCQRNPAENVVLVLCCFCLEISQYLYPWLRADRPIGGLGVCTRHQSMYISL